MLYEISKLKVLKSVVLHWWRAGYSNNREGKNEELKDAPLMNKITVRQSNGCYFTTVLLRTREDLLPGKTSLPLCWGRAVCSGSWSTAGSAPLSWAGADPALRAQGSTGTYWSNRGGSWSAVQQQQAHFCTDSQGLSRTGTMLGPYSPSLNSHQGLREMPLRSPSPCPLCLL